MEIYLIRHTKPAVAKGVCYGQSDIDVVESFAEEAALVREHVPAAVKQVYCSPLQRCTKLAAWLFPAHEIEYHADLMEINCGEWELRLWDEIPQPELQPWMDDFVQVTIPGGESYTSLYQRVTSRFAQVTAAAQPAAIVAHGGVIRSILAHITSTPLVDSFNAFKLHYGCVVRLTRAAGGGWEHTVLHNVPTEPETHKPAAF